MNRALALPAACAFCERPLVGSDLIFSNWRMSNGGLASCRRCLLQWWYQVVLWHGPKGYVDPQCSHFNVLKTIDNTRCTITCADCGAFDFFVGWYYSSTHPACPHLFIQHQSGELDRCRMCGKSIDFHTRKEHHMHALLSSRRPRGQDSIVRQWVSDLGPRLQGVLLTAIRGSDTASREADIKTLARFYRGTVIHGLNDSPKTFVSVCDYDQYSEAEAMKFIMGRVLKDHDAHPHHYLMHLIHAAQIVGEFHPHEGCRVMWNEFYLQFCNKMHMHPETKPELLCRLEQPDEAAFAAAQ